MADSDDFEANVRRRMSTTAGPALEERIEKRKPRPRWMLHLQAVFWRSMMSIGMFLHKLASPRPRSHAFTRSVQSTVSTHKGHFDLYFYVPKDYQAERQLGRKRYPVVVNFHGGGFTIGDPRDDVRWCDAVTNQVGAIAVSVAYRLAPEYPFPTAVEDGVDAILYLVNNAKELCVDIEKIAVSGFSAGANMAFTVPLRLSEELDAEMAIGEDHRKSVQLMTRPPLNKAISEGRMLTKAKKQINVKCVVAWYPPCDYTTTREEKKLSMKRLDQSLPAVFTDLFDESYLQPPTLDLSDPYLSPGVAPAHLLAGLPQEIMMFCCEWDMLLQEGERFRDRLQTEIGKTVHYHEVPGVPHGWDKAPNPLHTTPGVAEWYTKACKELKRLLHDAPPPQRRGSRISRELFGRFSMSGETRD